MSKQRLSLPERGGEAKLAGPDVPVQPSSAPPAPAPHIDFSRMTRERVVLAILPIASRAELTNSQQIVEKANELCEYIEHGLVKGEKPDPFQ